MTLDKILFILDNDITDENVLAILSAIQAYERAAISKLQGWNSTHSKMKKEVELEIYLAYEHLEHYFIFDRCLTMLKSIKVDAASFNQLHFDCVIKLSIANAMKIAKATNKPLADTLGIIAGGETRTLPDVSNLLSSFVSDVDVMIDSELSLTRNNMDDINNVVGALGKIVIFSSRSSSSTLQEKVSLVYASKAVIGYSSFETYLASALKKPVLEIQSNPHLYKWSNKNYICVTDDNNQEAINKGIRLCLQQVCEESMQMVAVTSSAQGALTT